MIEALYSGMIQIFTWPAFGLMLLGIAVGFVVGILPGIGGITTLALMLGFIFDMKPIEGFAFLLGMMSVTATTGDITSILFGVPGEGISAALVVDGHPMAKKGEAGRALGAALMSSLVGAVFGAVVLAAAVPIVRPLVLAFGTPELFMLTMLGICFIGAVSGNSITRGLIVGGFGLLLSTVGQDPQLGLLRYTFGQLYLWDGIPLVSVALGIFAIPEIIDLAVKGTSIAEQPLGRLGGVMEGVKDTFRHWKLVLRCSGIGTLIGILPGLGAGAAQWLAYGHAVQSSSDKERFGQGAVEGVLGPGAANNSKEGGSLLPTIAFGVPGSSIEAVLLGAFLVLGLVPGPEMLTKHLDVTFSMVWTIVVANIITVSICLLFLNQIAKITLVRGSILIPFIMLLVFLGAFSASNNLADVVTVLVFGFIGTIMVHLDWPRPPLLLGLVLGRLAERYLFGAIAMYGMAWLQRPIVLVLLVLILAAIIGPILRRRKAERKPTATFLNAQIFFSLSMVFVFAFAVFDVRDLRLPARLFPWAIGIPALVLALVHLGSALQSARKSAAIVHTTAGSIPPQEIRKRTIEIIAWILGFFAAIWLLGFPVAIPLVTFLYLKAQSRESWRLSIILGVLAWGFIYGLFDQLLHLPFPTGQLFFWLT